MENSTIDEITLIDKVEAVFLLLYYLVLCIAFLLGIVLLVRDIISFLVNSFLGLRNDEEKED